MFSLARRRREAERHKKLEEQFLKKDANGNGRITAEQMVEIFVENEVQVPNLEEEVAKLPDKDGWIRINEFMKFAMPLDLCKIEFHDRVFQKVDYEQKKKKEKKRPKKSQRSSLTLQKWTESS